MRPVWWIVYRKELRETLRDRRTLAVMILLPLVLYPLMSVIAAEWFIAHEVSRQARPSRVLVGGPGAGEPEVAAALGAEASGLEVTVRPELVVDRALGVRALGGADAVVMVPAGVGPALADGRSIDLQVYYDASRDDSELAEQRIGAALEAWADKELARRLEEEGLPAAFVEPVAATSVSLASRGKVGRAEIAKTLPFVIVLMVLMGAFYPAIDLTAGEKERGTLEPLLATPAPRRQIMAGKLATVATVSALTGLLNLLCMAGAALWIARSATRAAKASLPLGDVLGALPWGGIALALGALAVATLLFAGLMMAVASLARSFKEAQNFLTPVYLVATLPAMASWLPGTELTWGAALLPVANVTLLLKGAVAGTLSPGPALLALVASAGWAAAALALATRVYDSERLLFAPEAAPGDRQGFFARLRLGLGGGGAARMAPAAGRAAFEPAEALALYALCAVLLLGPGAELQAAGLAGIALSLWLCLGVPVLLAARLRAGSFTVPLGLGRPTARGLLGGLLIGASGWIVLATLILPIQEALFPTPDAIEQALEGLVAPDQPLALTLFAVAITPAVCEELLCRGAVARSLDRSLGRAGAVVVSALLFGLLHMSAYRFVPTFLLGVALALITLGTRTLWPAMLAHALNNASVVLLSTPTGASVAKALERTPAIVVGGPALVALVLGFALVRDTRK
jgi:sodium transport system permease protein